MTETATKRKYYVSFILDSRGYEEPVENIIEMLKGAMTELGADVQEVSELERRDFIRVTNRHHTGDFFLHANVEAPATFNEALQTRLRLEKLVKRVFVELA